MKSTLIAMATAFLLPAYHGHAGDYYAIPGKGNAENPGTMSHPWGTLEQAAREGKLTKLRGGDRVLLGSGYHGHVQFQGENKTMVVIEPMKGQKPELGRLTITKGSNWTVRRLTISPSCGDKKYKGSIVTIIVRFFISCINMFYIHPLRRNDLSVSIGSHCLLHCKAYV